MNGTVYVEAPKQYVEVQAQTATVMSEIPSSGTAVGGIYYYWDDNGFMSGGWQSGTVGSPMWYLIHVLNYVGDGTTQDENELIGQYLDENQNLDALFKSWEGYLNGLSEEQSMQYWDAFYGTVNIGCKERVH